MKKLLMLVFVLTFSTISFAQISLSGDLQVRPRLDIKDNGDYGGMTQDMYYMLRARLNINAKLGGGWYGKVQLGHYNYAGYAFTSGTGLQSSILSGDDLLPRPLVHFNEMYIGYKCKDTWGFQAGIVSESGLKNPMLDIHFEPTRMIDIPWTINHVGTFYGAKVNVNAGPGTVNLMLANRTNNLYSEDIDGNELTDMHDTYTVGLNYSFSVADFWFQPGVLFDYASEDVSAPMTFGLNMATPKFAGFGLGLTYAMTSNSAENTTEYSGNLLRVKVDGKVGPGAVELWYDMAKRTDTVADVDTDHDYGYIWAAYKIKVGSFDNGSVTVIPRWRHATETVDNAKDYSRDKIEVLLVASFK